MYKYKITQLAADKNVAEKEMNELGAEGWQLVNIVEYDGRIIWAKIDLGIFEKDADKLMEKLTNVANDWLKTLEKDKDKNKDEP